MDVTKKEQAYRLLKKAIIAGELQGGQIFSIDELSQRFETGKTPAREALIMLAHEGLIDPIPRSGYMVTLVTARDIQEIFHMRTILEVEAIALAVERITDADVASLRANQEEETRLSQATGKAKSYRSAYDLNKEFHLTIARASGNSRLLRLIEQHIDEMERMLARDPYIAESQQHLGIIEAVEQRDKTAAQEAMRQHLEETRFRLIDRF